MRRTGDTNEQPVRLNRPVHECTNVSRVGLERERPLEYDSPRGRLQSQSDTGRLAAPGGFDVELENILIGSGELDVGREVAVDGEQRIAPIEISQLVAV